MHAYIRTVSFSRHWSISLTKRIRSRTIGSIRSYSQEHTSSSSSNEHEHEHEPTPTKELDPIKQEQISFLALTNVLKNPKLIKNGPNGSITQHQDLSELNHETLIKRELELLDSVKDPKQYVEKFVHVPGKFLNEFTRNEVVDKEMDEESWRRLRNDRLRFNGMQEVYRFKLNGEDMGISEDPKDGDSLVIEKESRSGVNSTNTSANSTKAESTANSDPKPVKKPKKQPKQPDVFDELQKMEWKRVAPLPTTPKDVFERVETGEIGGEFHTPVRVDEPVVEAMAASELSELEAGLAETIDEVEELGKEVKNDTPIIMEKEIEEPMAQRIPTISMATAPIQANVRRDASALKEAAHTKGKFFHKKARFAERIREELTEIFATRELALPREVADSIYFSKVRRSDFFSIG